MIASCIRPWVKRAVIQRKTWILSCKYTCIVKIPLICLGGRIRKKWVFTRFHRINRHIFSSETVVLALPAWFEVLLLLSYSLSHFSLLCAYFTNSLSYATIFIGSLALKANHVLCTFQNNTDRIISWRQTFQNRVPQIAPHSVKKIRSAL